MRVSLVIQGSLACTVSPIVNYPWIAVSTAFSSTLSSLQSRPYLLAVAGCSYKMRFHYKFKPATNTDDLGQHVVEAINALAALPRFSGNRNSVFEGFGAESNLQFEVSAAGADLLCF